MSDELQNIILCLKEKILLMFSKDNTGHNMEHLERTMKNAIKIAKIEGGNLKVIAISAILHDVHRIMNVEQQCFVSPKNSIPLVRKLLKDINITEKEKEHICYAIEHHEEYSFGGGKVSVTDIESKILQDADNIDAAGAIGISRAFSFGAIHSIPVYDSSKPLLQGEYFEGANIDSSTIHHLVNKLARLYQTMNTETGRKMCKDRCQYIEDFVKQFLKEYNCDEETNCPC